MINKKRSVRRPRIEFTKDGLEKVKREYEELKKKRVEAVKELAVASAMGDRSENAAYKVGRQKLGGIDRQIRQASYLVNFGVVVEKEFTGVVNIGCRVTVHDGKLTKEYTIVGGFESDIMAGKLSCASPIGKALMGKKKDDVVHVRVPAGLLTFTVMNVELA